MRRLAIFALTVLLAGTFSLETASAQSRDRRGGQQDDDGAAAAKKRARDEEWNQPQAPLPQMRNAGPCPYVKVLYDAGRYVEFREGRETSADAGFTGEIQSISAGCQYKDAEPIQVAMQILFSLGKGPAAEGNRKSYRYWIAVTDRNREVLAKEYFDLPVSFPAGQDRTLVTETLTGLVIPRANIQVSGSNFEVLVGFDVTPAMAAFNRDGKRFRVDAGQAQAAPAAK